MATIDKAAPGDTDIVSQFPSNERDSRAAIADLIAGDAYYGGISGGSANLHTVSVSNTDFTLTKNYSVIFIPGNTSSNVGPSTVTLNVNGTGAKEVRYKNGGTPRAGMLVAGVLTHVIYDVSNGYWRILTGAGGWMDQTLYDYLFPVGRAILSNTTDDPNDSLPKGVTATWAMAATGRYLRTTDGTPATHDGNNDATGSGGSHTHTFTTGTPSATSNIQGGGSTAVPSTTHTHSGTTASGGSHSHSIDLSYRSFQVWVRTA